MKLFKENIGEYIVFGSLLATFWAVPLGIYLHRDAHGSSMELPRCDEARSLDYVRAALEEQSGQLVLGLHNATESGRDKRADIRRCTATVVTTSNESTVGFTIGWHDREKAIPFWMGDKL